MGVAAFVVHGGDPLGDKELALLYFVCFSAAAALVAGDWSIDGWRHRAAGRRPGGWNHSRKSGTFQSCLALTFIVH